MYRYDNYCLAVHDMYQNYFLIDRCIEWNIVLTKYITDPEPKKFSTNKFTLTEGRVLKCKLLR